MLIASLLAATADIGDPAVAGVLAGYLVFLLLLVSLLLLAFLLLLLSLLILTSLLQRSDPYFPYLLKHIRLINY